MKTNLLTRLRKYDVQLPKDVAAIDPKLSKIVKEANGSVNKAMSLQYPEEYNKVIDSFVNQNKEDINKTVEQNIHLKTILTNNTTMKDYVIDMFDEYLSAKKGEKEKVEQKYSSVGELIKINDIKVRFYKDFTTDAFNGQTKWNVKLKNEYFRHKFDGLDFPLAFTGFIGLGFCASGTGILLTDSLSTLELFNTTQGVANFAKGTLYSGQIGGASSYSVYKLWNSKHRKQADAMNLVTSEASKLDHYLNMYTKGNNPSK